MASRERIEGSAFVLALLGPIGFVRRFVRRVAVWAVPVALVYLTSWALDGADLGALWDALWRPGLVGAWIAGVALHQWLFQTGPGAWGDLVDTLDPSAWGVGATVPSFLASFAAAAVVALVSRRSGAPTPAT